MKKVFIFFALLCFAFFNGTAQNWEQVGLGAVYGVSKLYTDTINNVLYGGGYFKLSNGDTIKGIAKWDGFTWDSLGSGVGGVGGIINYNGSVYASGGIKPVGGTGGIYVGRWNGLSWDTVGGRFDNVILDLAIYNNELYAVGLFGSAGGETLNRIARWDGIKWWGVGIPTSFSFEPVWTAISYKNELYIGGSFIGGDSINTFYCIARWDGSNWNTVGNGLEAGTFFSTPVVSAFAIYNDELYIGGNFEKTSSNGNPGNYVAKWDGNSWYDVGGGTNGAIYDLVAFNNELYAVGNFTEAGGVPAQYIAKWDGTEWCGLGSTFSGGITTIAVYDSTIYIGGGFTTIDGDTINRIAKWTGGNYTDTCGVLTGVKEEFEVKSEELKIYPNPAQKSFTIEGNIQMPASIGLFDITGRKLLEQGLNTGHETISVSHLSKGIYIYRINTIDVNIRGKLVIE